MANITNTNPLYVDATGHLISVGVELKIMGVLVLPSNATWAITLQDGAGKNIFFSDNVGNGKGMPPVMPFLTTGLQVTTLTNCTALIYIA